MLKENRYCRLAAASCLLVPAILWGADTSAAAAQTSSLAALRSWIDPLWRASPRVEVARAGVEAAQALGRAAAQPLHNPELGLEVERAAETSAVVSWSQALDWNDRRSARTTQGEHEVQMARAEWDGARQSVVVEALTALAAYRTAAQLSALTEKHLDIVRRFQQLSATRLAAGDIGLVDSDLARLVLGEARIRRANARADEIDTEQALAQTVATRPASWPELPAELPTIALRDISGASLLQRLPELRALQARWQAVRAGAQVAQRERRSDPTIGLRAGRDGTDTLLGLGVSMPLMVRNTRQAEVQAVHAQALQAEQMLQDRYRRAQARLAAARTRYELLFDAWGEWSREGSATLGGRVTILNKLWEAGELSLTDYLVQLRETIETENAALELRGKVWGAWFEWLDASGQVVTWLDIAGMPDQPLARPQ